MGGSRAKGAVVTKYDSAGGQVVSTTLRVGDDDFYLRAAVTDRTFVGSSNLHGLTLGIEKPGLFSLDFNVKERIPRFQFSAAGLLLRRHLSLAYHHIPLTRDAVITEAQLAASPNCHLSAKLAFPNMRTQLRLHLAHAASRTALEPAVDLPSGAWQLALSHHLPRNNHHLRAAYSHAKQVVSLSWTKDAVAAAPAAASSGAGAAAAAAGPAAAFSAGGSGSSCKLSASIPLHDPKDVHLIMEKSWSFEF